MNNHAQVSFVLLMIWFLTPSAWAAQKLACDNNKPVSVYIDPFFGGQEEGPIIGAKDTAKDVVMNFALKLRAQLEKKGITSCLSRDGDYSFTLDERLVKAKISQSKLHFAVTMSSKTKGESCVSLHVPREAPRPARSEKEIDLNTILKDVTSDDKRERSHALSQRLRRSISEHSKQVCVKVLVEDEAFLSKSESPIVIIDFSVGSNTLRFIRETVLSDNFVSSVADAIVWYFTSDQRNP